MHTKNGEITGQPLWSMDGQIWHSSPATAVDVLKRTAPQYSVGSLQAIREQHATTLERGRSKGTLSEEELGVYEKALTWLDATLAQRSPEPA